MLEEKSRHPVVTLFVLFDRHRSASGRLSLLILHGSFKRVAPGDGMDVVGCYPRAEERIDSLNAPEPKTK